MSQPRRARDRTNCSALLRLYPLAIGARSTKFESARRRRFLKTAVQARCADQNRTVSVDAFFSARTQYRRCMMIVRISQFGLPSVIDDLPTLRSLFIAAIICGTITMTPATSRSGCSPR